MGMIIGIITEVAVVAYLVTGGDASASLEADSQPGSIASVGDTVMTTLLR